MPSDENITKVIQNLKTITIMRSSQYSDAKIAKFLGMTVKTFLQIIESDDYLRETYKNAADEVTSEIEAKFLEEVFKQLEVGLTKDAKWYLERTTDKYNKTEVHDVTVKSIDDVIRGRLANAEAGESDDE